MNVIGRGAHAGEMRFRHGHPGKHNYAYQMQTFAHFCKCYIAVTGSNTLTVPIAPQTLHSPGGLGHQQSVINSVWMRFTALWNANDGDSNYWKEILDPDPFLLADSQFKIRFGWSIWHLFHSNVPPLFGWLWTFFFFFLPQYGPECEILEYMEERRLSLLTCYGMWHRRN